MTVEKISLRARVFVVLISLLGIAAAVAGGILLSNGLHAAGEAHPTGDVAIAVASITPAALLTAVGLLLAVIPWIAFAILSIIGSHARDQAWRYEQVLGSMESQRQLLETVRETTSLSDAAKAIAYRQKDREALRQAIREDIDKGDFEAASQLVDDMEKRFGYRHEAEELREQIEVGWHADRERKIQETIALIESHVQRFDWTESARMCNRLIKLYPDHAEVKRLPDQIQFARDNHKRDLLKQWKDAVAKDDVDKSVELLKSLDQYLSKSEAEAYKESARDVFRKRLQQMGVQFALHVHDKSWTDAVKIGKQITDEFPNTRIAAEVREKMAILIEKANQPAGV